MGQSTGRYRVDQYVLPQNARPLAKVIADGFLVDASGRGGGGATSRPSPFFPSLWFRRFPTMSSSNITDEEENWLNVPPPLIYP